MEKLKQFWQKYLFTILMSLFMLGGSVATVQALQVNPPENLEAVVLGNVNPRTVNTAVRTNDDSLLEADDDGDGLFGDFFDVQRRGRGRGGRPRPGGGRP